MFQFQKLTGPGFWKPPGARQEPVKTPQTSSRDLVTDRPLRAAPQQQSEAMKPFEVGRSRPNRAVADQTRPHWRSQPKIIAAGERGETLTLEAVVTSRFRFRFCTCVSTHVCRLPYASAPRRHSHYKLLLHAAHNLAVPDISKDFLNRQVAKLVIKPFPCIKVAANLPLERRGRNLPREVHRRL